MTSKHLLIVLFCLSAVLLLDQNQICCVVRTGVKAIKVITKCAAKRVGNPRGMCPCTTRTLDWVKDFKFCDGLFNNTTNRHKRNRQKYGTCSQKNKEAPTSSTIAQTWRTCFSWCHDPLVNRQTESTSQTSRLLRGTIMSTLRVQVAVF